MAKRRKTESSENGDNGSTVVIENVGPIARLSIPIPPDGGVVVLRGPNGGGKSQSLAAVDSLLTGRGTKSLSVRDGETRGSVDGLGATLTVARSSRRSGELIVTSVADRFSIADLVDPGIADPDAADARRIRALVQLAGGKSPAEVYRVAIDQAAELGVGVEVDDVTGCDDLLVAAGRIKRGCEAQARRSETIAADFAAKAKAERAEPFDHAAPAVSVATEDYEAAVAIERSLRSTREAADAARAEAERLAGELAEAEKGGDDWVEARDAAAAAAEAEQAAISTVNRIRSELAAAEEIQRQATADLRRARERAKIAGDHAKSIDRIRAAIKGASALEGPTDQELAEAARLVEESRDKLRRAIAAEDGRKRIQRAEYHEHQRNKHDGAARKLRDLAGSLDDLLSSVVGDVTQSLRVKSGRLVCDTKRGTTLYADLSHGERWRLALDVLIDAFGEDNRPVFTIPQEAWESLDPTNKHAIAEHVRERGAVAIAAEAADGDGVVAESFEGSASNA